MGFDHNTVIDILALIAGIEVFGTDTSTVVTLMVGLQISGKRFNETLIGES